MAVETRLDITNYPFVLSGNALTREAEVIAQDAGRLTAMAKYTLMSQIPATRKWVPFTDETAVDGTEKPQGILMASLTAAQIVAGDVSDIPIYTGGDFTFDEDQLVIENSKTLNTVIGTEDMTVGAWIANKGMHAESTMSVNELENV
jgi:hypothetical protein